MKLLLFIITLLMSFTGFAQQNIPFDSSMWKVLSYKKIPSNQVEFENQEMLIKVQSSAGPIVFKLPEMKKVKLVRIKGRFKGQKNVESGDFDEDSILRIGLVATGDKKLNAFYRMVSPRWVKELFELAPKNYGLDKIFFLNFTNRKELLHRERFHPKSELIHEKMVYVIDKEGDFDAEIPFDETKQIAALWMSTDGDDTASSFEVQISALQLL